MSKSNWKIISASVAGTSHAAKNAPCQDSFAWRITESNNEVLIVVVSDGAGSAKNARVGAQTTCQTILGEIRAFSEKSNGIVKLNREQALDWLALLQEQLQILAAAEQTEKSDFACTLLAAVIENETAFFLQIGDGAMVYAAMDSPADYQLVTAPQQGEYANATNFVTDADAAKNLFFEKIKRPIREIAVFSDGLQRIALDAKTNAAHAPFFRPMFAPLETINVNDKNLWAKLENLGEQLSAYLDSPKINERTDDDKTLILASRR